MNKPLEDHLPNGSDSPRTKSSVFSKLIENNPLLGAEPHTVLLSSSAHKNIIYDGDDSAIMAVPEYNDTDPLKVEREVDAEDARSVRPRSRNKLSSVRRLRVEPTGKSAGGWI